MKKVSGSKTVKVSEARERLEQDILAAAKRLFAQRGFGGVSLDHIAREVGASKQNLLYYFPSKESCTGACCTVCWMSGCLTWMR